MTKPRQRVYAEISKASLPPKTTRDQRDASKQYGSAAIEFVRKQINILKPFELSQGQRLRTYQLMLQDDSVATCFNARTMAVAKAQKRGKFKYNTNSEESLRVKRFLEYNLNNLRGQSPLSVGLMASHMIRDGWSPFENVYEAGKGEWEGMWKLKKLAYIHPLSLDKFSPYVVREGGDSISHLRQLPDAFIGNDGIGSNSFKGTIGGVKEIPFNWITYSSYSSTDSSPSGNSLFDAAYIPWREKQLLQDLTLIGVQKDMAGMPVLGAPSSLLSAAAENPNGPEARMVEQLKSNLANLHAGDQAYSMIPTDTHSENGNGQRQFELKFLGIEGSGKQFDVVDLVEQRKRAIYNCFSCQNMISGENGGGSYNLLEGQTSLQAHAVELDNMVVDEMWNKQVIPKLLLLNGITLSEEDIPVWESGDVQEVSMDEYGKAVNRMARLLPAVPAVVNSILDKLGIPYQVEDNTTPAEIRDMSFEFKEPSKTGSGGGSSGSGDTQAGGSSSDTNSENAA
jgi:hypothetical protein